MGGGGSIQGMITALRNNKNLLSKRKSMYDKKGAQNTSGINNGLNCNIEATEEQLFEIRTRIQKRNRNRKILFLTAAIIGFLITFIFIFQINKFKIEKEQATFVFKPKALADYQNLISNGDTWLADRKWNAAIYNYQKAVDIYPDNFDANYRLALAYAYSCIHDAKHCDSGNLLMKKLMVSQGENKDVLYLEAILMNNQNQ
jgi:hypothetical protein